MCPVALKWEENGGRYDAALHSESTGDRKHVAVASVSAAVSLITNVGPASLAVATDCQIIEDGGTIQGRTTGKGTTLSNLPRTIIASQDILKSALFNQAMSKSIGKIQAKAYTQSLKMSALPYNGKRSVTTIRTTPPEIRVSARSQAATIIGPVQKIRKPTLSGERSVSQVVAAVPSTVESPSLFGGQPFVGLNPFQNALQRPDNEFLRMNLTTTQALHGGNCGSGCP